MSVAVAFGRATFDDRDMQHSARHSRVHLSATRVAVLTVRQTPERHPLRTPKTTTGQKCNTRVFSSVSRRDATITQPQEARQEEA